MDFIDACKVILRRWYVVVPLLALTIVGTYFAYSTASANYSAKGALVLNLPTARVLEDGETSALCPTNTWCAGGDVLSLANVTALSMDDPRLKEELLDPHRGADYEVILNADNNSAILQLTATARSPKDAIATLDDLKAQVEQELQGRQLEVPNPGDAPVNARDLVTTSEVTMANQAVPQSGGKLRAAAAAFGLGLAITLGGAFFAESVAASRRANASLLDRIALPDQSAGGSGPTKAKNPAVAADPAGTASHDADHDRPKPVSAGQRGSGRVGS